MARFLHIADCHLGCRQYGLRQREEDFYAAFADAADKAVENKVDAVIVAGDLFDSVKPSAEAVYIVKKIVSKLWDHMVPVFGIEGNHDITGDGYWLDVCGIRPLNDVGGSLNDFTVGGVRIAGLPYMRPDQLVQRLRENADVGSKCGVLALHAGFVEMGDSYTGELSIQSVLPMLQEMEVKYVALGHIHVPLEAVVGGIHFVQPGSTELKDISETPHKHAMLVEIDENGVRQSPIPLKTRPVEHVTVMNEDDLHKLLEGKLDFAGKFVVVSVANTVPDGAKRIEEALKGSLFRLSVFDNTNGVQGASYERDKAIPTLAAAISEFFDEDSDQYRLVSQILATPDNLRQIAEDYINSTAETKE